MCSISHWFYEIHFKKIGNVLIWLVFSATGVLINGKDSLTLDTTITHSKSKIFNELQAFFFQNSLSTWGRESQNTTSGGLLRTLKHMLHHHHHHHSVLCTLETSNIKSICYTTVQDRNSTTDICFCYYYSSHPCGTSTHTRQLKMRPDAQHPTNVPPCFSMTLPFHHTSVRCLHFFHPFSCLFKICTVKCAAWNQLT